MNVPQAVRFIDHNHVPWDLCDSSRLGGGEVVRADDGLILLIERVTAILLQPSDNLSVQNLGGDEELLAQLLLPLLAEHGGHDNENAPAAFSPLLRKHDTCFDRLAQSDFVGQDRTVGERRTQSEESGVDLMGIQVNPRIGNRPR